MRISPPIAGISSSSIATNAATATCPAFSRRPAAPLEACCEQQAVLLAGYWQARAMAATCSALLDARLTSARVSERLKRPRLISAGAGDAENGSAPTGAGMARPDCAGNAAPGELKVES